MHEGEIQKRPLTTQVLESHRQSANINTVRGNTLKLHPRDHCLQDKHEPLRMEFRMSIEVFLLKL